MPVRQLRRIALGLAWDGFDAQLVYLPRGSRREHHTEPQFREKCKPERIVLVHIEHPWDADLAPRSLRFGEGFVVEIAVQLVVKEVRHGILCLFLAQTPLAAVAGDELPASAEMIDGQAAGVRASAAFGHGRGVLHGPDVVDGEHGRPLAVRVAFAGDERRAESSHDACNVRADGVASCNLLEAAENRIVVEGTALHDDVVPQLRCAGDLDDLKERVLDDRVGKSGGDIRYRGTFFLRLLDFGVHKYCTAGPKVNGILRVERLMGEILHAVVQGFGKGLDKGAASRRACLVELYAVYGLVLYLDAFHILTADVQDAVYIRLEESGGVEMGHCFHLALVQHERCLDERFAVAGGAGVYDFHVLRELGIDVFDGGDGRSQRVAVIVVVERVEQGAVLAHKSGFRGGRASVNAEERLSFIGGKVLDRDLMLRMARGKCFVFRVGGKEGLQTLHLNLHLHLPLQTVLEFPEGDDGVFLGIQRGTDGCEQMGMVRRDDVLVVQLQGADKGCPQLREEVEGSAQERHMSPDGFAAGKSADGLVHYSLEDGRGKVFPGSPVIDEGLDV